MLANAAKYCVCFENTENQKRHTKFTYKNVCHCAIQFVFPKYVMLFFAHSPTLGGFATTESTPKDFPGKKTVVLFSLLFRHRNDKNLLEDNFWLHLIFFTVISDNY